MRIYRGFSQSVPAPVALAIGNFDGVHRGHTALLERLLSIAEKENLTPTVLTFEPHPREFFSAKAAPARLSILREKIELLEAAGIQQIMICPFNQALASLNATEFIEKILCRALKVKHLVVGDDFHFGRQRQGNFALLQEAGKTKGFSVEKTPTVLVDGQRVSSSAIREALKAGDMAGAAVFLGRPYAMDGKVRHGQKLGKQLGFATANLHVKHQPLPLLGVFAVAVTGLSEEPIQGIANLGTRPTIEGERVLLEVHLFDFSDDIYGAPITVHFLHYLREERRFLSVDALKAQIANDAGAARDFFASQPL